MCVFGLLCVCLGCVCLLAVCVGLMCGVWAVSECVCVCVCFSLAVPQEMT